MAIVLIIIGIIIGAVVKGKDVIKSAEQKRLYSTFAREWQVAYNNYYDRTGWILGDDTDTANTTRDGLCGNAGTMAAVAALDAQLSNIGLTPPANGPTGASNVRTYTDSFGQQYTMTVQFNNNTATGNFIQISGSTGIPLDLGMAWDRIIDGSADGQNGDLLFDDNTGDSSLDAWPADASQATDSGDAIILRLEF
jgi:hypothetical protein